MKDHYIVVNTGFLYHKKQSGSKLFIAKNFQLFMSRGAINSWKKTLNKVSRLAIKMENNISQAAFNQKLFFPEKKKIFLQLLFREWCESNGVEFDTNCMGVLMTATLQPSATTLVIWLTVWVEPACNPHEHVAQFISYFLIATCCGFQNVSSIAAGFWGLIITVTISSNVIGA